MPLTHNLTQTWSSDNDGRSVTKKKTLSSGLAISIDETIADSETDKEVAFALDVTQLQMIYIVSDQDILLETNDGAAPTQSFSLLANEPLAWHVGSLHSNPITGDITGNIFITNSSGSPARLQIEALVDPTV